MDIAIAIRKYIVVTLVRCLGLGALAGIGRGFCGPGLIAFVLIQVLLRGVPTRELTSYPPL
jgi:hypothetical protein